jgi:hypothetical protein
MKKKTLITLLIAMSAAIGVAAFDGYAIDLKLVEPCACSAGLSC